MLGGFTIDGGASRRADAYSPARDTLAAPSRPPDRRPSRDGRRRRRQAVRARRLHGGRRDAASGLRARARCVAMRFRACRSRARPPVRASRAGRSSSPAASARVDGSRGTRSRSISARGAGRSSRADAARASRRDVARRERCTPSAGARPASTRTSCTSRASDRATAAWRRLQPVPDPRGGTGAAALAGRVISVGGEEPDGTIEEVLEYRIAERRWVRLDDLPTPRHGVGVAALGGRVYVIGGGPEPGLTVSSANESLDVRARRPRRPAATRGCGRSGSGASRDRPRRSRAAGSGAARAASRARSRSRARASGAPRQ